MEESCSKVSEELLNGLVSTEHNQTSKLSHLNSFVTHLNHHPFSHCTYLKHNTVLNKIIMCLKQCFLKESLIIRIAVLRCLRYLCIDSFVISLLFKINVHHLIIRSLDTPYESEKLQAIRLIRSIILPYTDYSNNTLKKSHNIEKLQSNINEDSKAELNETIPLNYMEALLRPVVAIVNKGDTKKNKMFHICVCTLCETVLKNAALVERIGGLRALFWKPSTHPYIYNIIIITIVHLLNMPSSFKYYKYLQKLVSSFTDFRNDMQPTENETQEQDFCKQSIIRMLKTWCGFYHLCYIPHPSHHLSAVQHSPHNNVLNLEALYTPIQDSVNPFHDSKPTAFSHQNSLSSLLEALPLSSISVQSDILDVFYGWFNIQSYPTHKSFQDFSLKPSSRPERWGLLDGFIAAEACDLLPSSNKFSISRFHRSLHLACLLQLNFQEVLAQLVIEADTTIAIKACVLLAHWSSICYDHLPHKNTTNHLSTLVHGTCHANEPHQRTRCREALKLISRIQQKTTQNMLCSTSPFLRQQYHFYNNHSLHKHNLFQCLSFDSFTLSSTSHFSDKETLADAVRRSRVLYSNSYKDWQWEVVLYILKLKNQVWEKVELVERFLSRLTEAFKPSTPCFSSTSITSDEAAIMTSVLFLLVQLFVTTSLKFAKVLFASFLKDINTNLKMSIDGTGAFQNSNLLSYCSINYFLILGCLSSEQETNQLLVDNLVYKHMLLVMSSAGANEILKKLIISSLDYSSSPHPKNIIASACSSSSKATLLYCTDFLRLLVRCNGCRDWMLVLLYTLINHRSSTVSNKAVSVLLEASNHEKYLRSISQLDILDVKGGRKSFEWECLMARLAAYIHSPHLPQLASLWHHNLNNEYAERVEEKLLNDNIKNNPFSFQSTDLPVHLLGELSRSDRGLEMMFGETCCRGATEGMGGGGDQASHDLVQVHIEAVESFVNTLNTSAGDKNETSFDKLANDAQAIKKTTCSLWALGHIGSTEKGLVRLLQRQGCLVEWLVSIAGRAWPLSLRGTAFCVLNMMASVEKGREMLQRHGWVCYASNSCYREDNIQFSGELGGEKVCMQDCHSKGDTVVSKQGSSLPTNQDSQSKIEKQQATPEEHNDKTHLSISYTSVTRESKAHYSTSPTKSSLPPPTKSSLPPPTSLLPPTSLMSSSKSGHKKKAGYKMFKNFFKKIKPKTMLHPSVSPYSTPARSIDAATTKGLKNDLPSSVYTDNKHFSFTPSITSITTSISSLSVTPSYYPPSFPDDLAVDTAIPDSISPFYSLTSLRKSKKEQRNKHTLSLDYRSSDVASKAGLKKKFQSIRSSLRFKVAKKDLMKQVQHDESFPPPFDVSPCATLYVCLPRQLSSLFQDFALEKTTSFLDFVQFFSQNDGASLFDFSHKHQALNCIRCSSHLPRHLTNYDDEDASENIENNINNKNNKNNNNNENNSNKNNSNKNESDIMNEERKEEEESGDVWKEVISLVMHLSSTVPSRSCQQALYSIKEKNPEYFRDECLYSDVAEVLNSAFFSAEARTFTQSLFEF